MRKNTAKPASAAARVYLEKAHGSRRRERCLLCPSTMLSGVISFAGGCIGLSVAGVVYRSVWVLRGRPGALSFTASFFWCVLFKKACPMPRDFSDPLSPCAGAVGGAGKTAEVEAAGSSVKLDGRRKLI